MRSVVVSDLHLGALNGADLLRRPDLRRPLIDALEPGGRLVILGDGLELREIPVRAATALMRDLLAEAGRALGPEGEVVLSAGNHDHGLVAPWIDARLQQDDPPALALEETVEASGSLPEALAEAARPARLRIVYPGLFLRDDVYAMHGHYSDVHTTVPTFERLAAGVMTRHVTHLPDTGASPDDYEAVLAPIYAWMFALTQRQRDGVVRAGAGASAKAWLTLSAGPRTLRGAALYAGYAGAVATVNVLGFGPVRRHLSGSALRQGALHGIGEVIRRLEIPAEHVIWGHSHRAGPFPHDDLAEWTAPTGARIHNTGSWVFQRHFLPGPPESSPYWPGMAVIVDDHGPPRLERLLRGRTHDELTARPA